jgi:hypothetical protein
MRDEKGWKKKEGEKGMEKKKRKKEGKKRKGKVGKKRKENRGWVKRKVGKKVSGISSLLKRLSYETDREYSIFRR